MKKAIQVIGLAHKEFDINYIDLDEGGGGQRKGIREGSLQ